MISYDPKNYLRVLLDFPRSPIFRTLVLDVIGAGVYAFLVVWLETDVVKIAVPLGPSFLSILGIILGLLLVFRTNTAYDRWWEGRKLWGQLVNVSRGLAHSLDALLPHGSSPGAPHGSLHGSRRAHYAELLAAFPAILSQHLRRPRQPVKAGEPAGGEGDAKGDARRAAGGGRVTPPASEGRVAPQAPTGGEPASATPNELVRQMQRSVHEDVRGGLLPTEAIVALTPLLVAFDDITGACERIRNTPIPFSYSSYIKQFVILYALVLPFGLVREFGYGTIIASMFTFFATMGLELLATEIEEPFGGDRNDLPLDELAARIATDVRALLR